MSGKLKGWFSGLSKVGKTTALLVAGGILVGGVGAIADPCTEATVYTNKTFSESSSFQIISTKDPNLNVDQIQIQKPGIEGKNNVTNKVGTKCDKQVSKQSIKTVVVSKPVSQEQTEGSKEVTIETQEVPVAFSNQNVADASMDKGTTKVVKAGVNGAKTVTFEVVKIDGKEQSRTQKSENVTLQPVNQITNVGAKVKSNCDPNYSGACVPIASDVDCAGGSGNGPAYVGGPVYVVGSDIYGLDRDGDGIVCE
jgi:resuscitation-promoting factor RpfB